VTWNDINALVFRLLSRWWIVALITAIVVAGAAWRVSAADEQYRTSTLIVVSPNPDLEPSEMLRAYDLLSSDMVMGTYSDVLASPLVVNAAMRMVSPATGRWTGYEIAVVSEPDSNVMRLTVDGPNADAVEALTKSVRDQGSVVLTQLFSIFVIESLSNTEPDAELVSLPWTQAMAFALVLGLGFGSLVAVWFDSLVQYRRSAPAVPGNTRGASSVDRERERERAASSSTIAPLNRQ
jgi:capsular polysaccharide biosynthesis protein